MVVVGRAVSTMDREVQVVRTFEQIELRNLDPHHCQVTIDGQPSNNWRIVDGELEIATMIGQHTFVIAP